MSAHTRFLQVGIVAAIASVAAAQRGEYLLKITAEDAGADVLFGRSVALSDDTLLAADIRYGDGDSDRVYTFDPKTGRRLLKLVPEERDSMSSIGGALAIDQHTALIGTPGPLGGAAYLFDARSGLQLHKLVATDGDTRDLFGGTVAISGNTALVSARAARVGFVEQAGVVYVFDVQTGGQEAKLTADDAGYLDGFGTTVALDGSLAAIGTSLGGGDGSVYVFDVHTGQQLHKLTPPGVRNDRFGASVAISGTRVLVGAPGRGAVFGFDAVTGKQLFELRPSFGLDQHSGGIGSAVAISGSLGLVAGQSMSIQGTLLDQVFLFDASVPQGLWLLEAPDAGDGAQFGFAVDTNGSLVAVGAPGADAIYIFDASLSKCRADLSSVGATAGDPDYGVADGKVTAADLWYYLTAWVAGDPVVADLVSVEPSLSTAAWSASDGLVSAADLNCFVNAWLEGCP